MSCSFTTTCLLPIHFLLVLFFRYAYQTQDIQEPKFPSHFLQTNPSSTRHISQFKPKEKNPIKSYLKHSFFHCIFYTDSKIKEQTPFFTNKIVSVECRRLVGGLHFLFSFLFFSVLSCTFTMYTYFSLLFFLHLALFSIINYPSALPFSHSILHFLLDLAFGAFSNFRFLFFLPTHDTFHMETPDFSPPHADASRPSLGFPLGTALLLLVIFTLSGIFSCCYHWDKLRSIRRSAAQALHHDHHLLPSSPSKSNPTALVILIPLLLHHFLSFFRLFKRGIDFLE